ncbi:hypothetical protein BFP72_18040 [Reichenbachiella sp. 5M10]|nr:hypothetical protein BFP72_18040 [Reichenbachiella sp. 5M10]
MLVGTYTGQGSEGIYSIQFDPATGAISDKQLVATTTSPSYLALSPDKQRVYAVNEGGEGNVTAYQWNDSHTQLDLINSQSSQGLYPCYVSLQDSLVAIANYGGGNVVSYPLDAAGALSDNPVNQQHEGTGPNSDRQEAPHAHCAVFSKDGQYLYGVDLGIDQIRMYSVADLTAEGEVALQLDAGDGPRHLTFHPNKDIAFVISELSSTVTTASIDPLTGKMTALSKVSTLPEGHEGDNSCADIHVSDDGRYLYASNRGHNSIAIFSIDPETSALKMIATESVMGDWPRNFTLSPDNNYILVANKKSNNITVFKRDKETGMMYYTDQQLEISQPVCLKF